ncbi:MAG: RNA-binding domain-containing protein [Syntrophales bacterium]
MANTHLPINIDELIEGRTVEGERLEFKKGWNPEAVIHTLCAFANDFHNLGGGYIVIGIEEKDGRPILPPAGILANSIDKIQKEIVALGYRIQPAYHPTIAHYIIQERHVLILWSSGGQTRPYKAPVSLSKKAKEFAYYIRKASATVRATHNDEVELLGLTATVPFDDRIAHQASLDDLNLALIRDFLREVGSNLYEDATVMDFPQLCRQMHIVSGPEEMLKPLNVGLLFFNDAPDRFFPQAQIDVVQFPDGSVNLEDLQTGSSTTRRYRNRRIGEFLKELSLTEGRGTGIPKILRAIRKNGSPLPVFETNEERIYFVARFPIHPGALKRITEEDRAEIERAGTKSQSKSQYQSRHQSNKQPLNARICLYLAETADASISDISKYLCQKRVSGQLKVTLKDLMSQAIIEYTIPDKPQSRLQWYRLTEMRKACLDEGHPPGH